MIRVRGQVGVRDQSRIVGHPGWKLWIVFRGQPVVQGHTWLRIRGRSKEKMPPGGAPSLLLIHPSPAPTLGLSSPEETPRSLPRGND